jgi:integrase
MATITATILKDNKKQDNSWNVVYRLTHNRKSRYIKTHHYVTKNDLTKSHEIKPDYLIDHLATEIKKYRAAISAIEGIKLLSVDEVKDIITNDTADVELLAFFEKYINKLKSEGRNTTAGPYLTVLNYLKDYNNGSLYASKLTSKFLSNYEDYLRKPKTIERVNQFGGKTVMKNKFLTDKGVHNHMASLRTMFNAAREYYNDEDTGKIIIKNYPFSKYKIKPKKNIKHKDISLDQVKQIIKYTPVGRWQEIAKAMFMTSFYLCGMNAVDIFQEIEQLASKKKRIEYNRSKTKGKRSDEAFISINIPNEVRPYIEVIKNIDTEYSSARNLTSAISKGLRAINEVLQFETLIMYSARHSFATIARNDCGISKDDIALALNHVSSDNRVTDVYIKPDWSIIDNVQRAVIDKLNEK